MIKVRNKKITAQQQLFYLKMWNPHGKGSLSKGKLTWRWEAQPTPISRIYQARIQCDSNGYPNVFVDSPDIVLLADGRRLPHVYNQDTRNICLFLPSSGEWSTGKLLAKTLVPWTSLWLLYFEEWLISDDWKGGGLHPNAEGQESEKVHLNKAMKNE